MIAAVDVDSAWARLMPHLLQLRKRVEECEAAKRQPVGADREEQALAAADDEQEAAIDDVLHRQLEEVEAAMKRIEAGTYGRCVDCGGDIAEARLRALPTALRCIACEREQS
jgi:RNA polymerase-binding transcription factor DksA